ncbi:hypothetical protein [Accumulibacter sp.]|uniref:hypothetical protein n=1 Tax=Accumulibacter sp. TaxID=2053492 RepID=UPI0025879938|nr:hypothetical protein [Accumulibacter sp.]MCM8580412.1 hypothetical protein [Accumulibacter sp.]
MIENVEIVYLEPPESARFLNMLPTTSAQYMLYCSSSSLIPSSFDQVLKNNVLPVGSDSEQFYKPIGVTPET